MFIYCLDTNILAITSKAKGICLKICSTSLFDSIQSQSLHSNKGHSESFLDIDVDRLYEILNNLDKLLPGQFVVIVGVIDGVKLIKFLLVK